MESLKETNITDYDHFEDSLNSTIDSLDGHNNITNIKLYKDLPSENSLTQSIGEQSFNDICNEFSIFLNDEDGHCKIETKFTTTNDNDSYEEKTNLSDETKMIELSKLAISNKNSANKNEKIYQISNLPTINDNSNDKFFDKTITENKEEQGVNYTFQDIDSEFFETDCETTETIKQNKTENSFKFHDLDSEFFETDAETTDNERKYFQDVESDFFDEDDLISPDRICSTPIKVTTNKNIKKESPSSKINKITLTSNQTTYDLRHTTKTDKTTALSNSLLRSTINELEKALNDSNILLAKRDLKIQELRHQNNELKTKFEDQFQESSQLKLLLLEKDSVLSDNENKIQLFTQHVEKTNKELNELRLYKMNNLPNQDSYSVSMDSSQGSSDENSFKDFKDGSEQHIECKRYKNENDCTVKNSSYSAFSNNKKCRYRSSSDIGPKSPIESEIKPIGNQCKKKCFRKQNSTSGNLSNKESGLTETTTPSENITKSDEKLSQSELHAHLRMKFMRDAFFYYMIGFHPDEQMNAILAILDYGDKRQDFVLEAHKMKKIGKKVNVTKVSSRGLNFIQEIKDMNS